MGEGDAREVLQMLIEESSEENEWGWGWEDDGEEEDGEEEGIIEYKYTD
jgi:hypothetical protein